MSNLSLLTSNTRSACFEHDVMVRNAWVTQMPADMTAKVQAIAPAARFAIYRDLDSKIKTKYLDTLRDLNQKIDVIHIKGFGPTRQSKNQQPLDWVLMSVAADVLIESGFTVSN